MMERDEGHAAAEAEQAARREAAYRESCGAEAEADALVHVEAEQTLIAPVGPARDEQVAREVFGWIPATVGRTFNNKPVHGWHDRKHHDQYGIPKWSTDDRLRWELEAECDRRGWGVTLEHLAPSEMYSQAPQRYSCIIRGPWCIAFDTSYNAALTAAMLEAVRAQKEASRE